MIAVDFSTGDPHFCIHSTKKARWPLIAIKAAGDDSYQVGLYKKQLFFSAWLWNWCADNEMFVTTFCAVACLADRPLWHTIWGWIFLLPDSMSTWLPHPCTSGTTNDYWQWNSAFQSQPLQKWKSLSQYSGVGVTVMFLLYVLGLMLTTRLCTLHSGEGITIRQVWLG